MRFLVTTESFAPLGGVEHSTLQVSAELVRRGHECRLLHSAVPTSDAGPETGTDAGPQAHPGSLRPDWERVAATITRVPGFTVAARRPWRTLHHLPPTIRAAHRIEPDAIYLNRSEQLPWALAARRRPFSDFTDAGLVVHLRHHPFPGPLVRLLCARPIGSPRVRFIAVSDFIRDTWVANGLNPEVVRVVPNGVDPQCYRPPSPTERHAARSRLGITDDRPVVLCYGRLNQDKGVDTLLDSWSRLAPLSTATGQAQPRLLLVGDATPEIATRIDAPAARAQGVRHLPRRAGVVDLLHAADLVVAPSRWDEPFGRVLIEAMAAGLPVIATRVGGIPEILTGPFADLLVPPADPEVLARAIGDTLDWRIRKPWLGWAARDHVRAHFTLDRTADAVEDALVEVADGTGPVDVRRRRPIVDRDEEAA